MLECTDRMYNDAESYTFDEYSEMEKNLTESINKLIQEVANKYCVIPVIELLEPNVVSVYIINKTSKRIDIEKLRNS